jgi:xanthine dehydrogenase YagS FAD-binding subunit
MRPFHYVALTQLSDAVAAAGRGQTAAYLAGGTNLIDEMKLNVQTPRQLVDINGLDLANVAKLRDGTLRVGALVRNSDLAWNDQVRQQYPVLSEALLSGASPQLRNMATTGGNLLQHTRCVYFRDVASPCNMRKPGAGCSAIGGYNRMHAVLGTSDKCIATHPSDMCVAMMALDAVIHVIDVSGERDIPIADFHIAYGDDPARLNVLQAGELITHVDLPPLGWVRRSHYLKVRDRSSYEFALASAAVALEVEGGTIRNARVALGGVATKPRRAVEAEKSLIGNRADDDTFRTAAGEALKGAKPQQFNGFKIELAKRTLIRALQETVAL